ARFWPTFNLRPDSSSPRSSPGTRRGKGRRRMTQFSQNTAQRTFCCVMS
uniref:Uncharacterized protein n=1 Tax=Gasterosteus aculeatus TaxID=69293 RepID=G3P8F5_GASAC